MPVSISPAVSTLNRVRPIRMASAPSSPVAIDRTQYTPSPVAPKVKAKIQARGELSQLKTWMTVTGAKIGAGAALFAAAPFAFGHPIGWLMFAGLAAAAGLGAAAGGFVGSQLGDLGEYESGRIALQNGGRPH